MSMRLGRVADFLAERLDAVSCAGAQRRRGPIAVALAAVLALMCEAAAADEVCFQYTKGPELLVGLDAVPVVPARDPALMVFDRFIAAARRNDIARIQALFSRLDGSADYLARELTQIPDKFSLYAGLGSVTNRGVYLWGNYHLLLTHYVYPPDELTMPEPVLCTNVCQMSNVLERPADAADLVSRYFLWVLNQAAPAACPDNGYRIIAVNPRVTFDADHPLRIRIRDGLLRVPRRPPSDQDPEEQETTPSPDPEDTAARPDGEQKQEPLQVEVPDEVEDCWRRMVLLPFDGPQSELERLVAELIEDCAVNTTVGKMTPVVNLNDPINGSYFDALSFVALLATATEIIPIAEFRDGGRHVVMALVITPVATERLVLLPFVNGEEGARFDWNYFNSPAAQVLTSEAVGAWVLKQREPETGPANATEKNP